MDHALMNRNQNQKHFVDPGGEIACITAAPEKKNIRNSSALDASPVEYPSALGCMSDEATAAYLIKSVSVLFNSLWIELAAD